MSQPITPEAAAGLAAYFENLNMNLQTMTTTFADAMRRVGRKVDDSKVADKSTTHRFPDVETFDGTDSHKFRPWVTQMNVFFSTQPAKFVTDQARIFYAGNRLRGDALEWYGRGMGDSTQVGTDNHPVWVSWSSFADSMRTLFGRRDEETEARRRLDNIKQGSRDLVAYINELEQLDSIATLSDELKLYIFKRGLTQDLRDRLALWTNNLETYTEASQAALQLARQTEEYQKHSTANRAYPRRTAMNRDGWGQTATTPKVDPATVVDDPDAMDIDAAHGPHKPLTAEEKNRRRVEGLCNYCAGKGHIAVNCPSKQQRAPARNSALPGQSQGN